MTLVLLWLLVVVLVLVGIAGVIFPALPGPPFVFAGLVLAAWIDRFERVSVFPTLTIIGVLTALTVVVDVLATALGARRVGASGKALWGAAIGTAVGFFFGLPGLVFGPFLGAAAGQFLSHGDLLHAGRVGVGTWLGILIGAALKVALVFTMIAVFVTAYFV
ncbi:MAG TPA: DUF456 domain-containing protein [Gammaproteobacteria bacterium]|nr:DUF456 domain-containing protein [Gammaproteobacteria bacterium]